MGDDRAVAGKILDAAKQAVGVERTNHGNVESSFQMIADLWSVRINHATAQATGLGVSPQIHLSAFDVAEMMQDVKSARALYGDRSNPDNYIDRAGYASLAGMLADAEPIKPEEPKEPEEAQRAIPRFVPAAERHPSDLGFLKTDKAENGDA